ncbi:MAG: hypothetical protein WD716_07680 [Fimbriimonadaceae bacterium]
MEQLRKTQQDHMTPVEAEEVLKRFREEEESRQKEMEAQATNPTVADLAEGLGVSQDRIAALLSQVRRDAPQPVLSQPISTVAAQEYVRRQNTSAWVIALIIISVVAFAFVTMLFMAAPAITIENDPATVVTPAPDEPTAPAPVAPSETP